MMKIYGEHFYGNKVSDYGLEHGKVDYRTLAMAFDAVLNNEIMSKTWDLGEWEQESGFVDNSDEIESLQEEIDNIQEEIDNLEDKEETIETIKKMEELKKLMEEKEGEKQELENEQYEIPEVFQWYIVSDNGAEILKEANEIVYYHENLDMYLWGIEHYGTGWDYVLTDIVIDKPENAPWNN